MGWELRALRHAAGEEVEGELNNTWGEANLYKLIETIAYSLAQFPDNDLESRVDQIIGLIGRAQQSDGYSHFFVINSGKQPWDPSFLDGSHDGYVLGHMIEAAIAWNQATGKDEFLRIACAAADQAYDHFLGPQGVPGFCGHAELEMALVELYRATHESRYLELARAFIEWRGRGLVTPAGPTPRAYFQDEVPLRLQRTLEGHAVRAVFFASGVTDLAIETGDCDYRLAANRFWDSVAHRRMTITGSVGPRSEHEALGDDYELPDDGYYESCAACGMVDFAHRMFFLERRSEYIDVLEQVLYNAVLHGISLDGVTSYYQNPLSDADNPRYNSWVCCPPNLSRTLMQIGRYAYAGDDQNIYVNLFVGGSCIFPKDGGDVKLHVTSDYPWSGRVRLRFEMDSPREFTLHLRRPGWCTEARLSIMGWAQDPSPAPETGYVVLQRLWQPGDTLELDLAMPVVRMEAHPNIYGCEGKVALQRGPLVYAFEGLDNNGDPRISLGADPSFKVEHRPELLGGIQIVSGFTAEGKPFRAVPFYALANREVSAQEVWAEQTGFRRSKGWWMGHLYRPLRISGKQNELQHDE
jgi:DUF1680 family protein